MNTSIRSKHARILAPLDNILWDRKLVAELFSFEYKWEVYTPAPERKYGYYVLPVLSGSRFIGRIEMETDKKRKVLVTRNFWPEEEIDISEYRENLLLGIEKFTVYNLCNSMEICCRI